MVNRKGGKKAVEIPRSTLNLLHDLKMKKVAKYFEEIK